MTGPISSSRIVGGNVWPDFSSIQTPLKFPEPKEVKVDAQSTLLQIVDMQTDFVGAEIRKTIWKGDQFISNVQALLHKARELDMTVVFQYSTSIRNPYEKTIKRLKPEMTFGSIIDELKPMDRPKELFVSKITHDIFFHTYMDDLLSKLPNINTVIVTGVDTKVCVLYAVSGFCVRGYKVIVPMDAVITTKPENQAATLHVMAAHSANFPATMTLSNMITFEL